MSGNCAGYEGAYSNAIRAEKFHGDNSARDAVEPLELYSKLITTLPVELRRDFRRLTEWRTADEIARLVDEL